jgi:hypothetical protein
MRGVCADCAVDLKKGLACKGHCEADVHRLLRTVALAKRLRAIGAGFFLAIGGLQILWSYSAAGRFDFSAAIGLCFVILGILFLASLLRTNSSSR